MSAPDHAPPPSVTIISGFLGAGKTTLLNHILTSCEGRRLGVLVNDFGAVNIDAALIIGVEDDVISLSNGCICCTIKNDVVAGVMRLLERPDRPEHIVVETSGVSDPGTVAQTFLDLQRQGHLRLDGIVAVVDAEQFSITDPDTGMLARCQVMAADLVVVNKVDLVEASRLSAVREAVGLHAPDARIVEAEHGVVSLDVLLCLEGSGAEQLLPQLDLHVHAVGEHEHHAHHVHHGLVLATWHYTAERSMRFSELAPALTSLPSGIYRVKGFVTLVERPGARLVLHVVGRRVYVRTLEGADASAGTELVFIGKPESLDPDALRALLDGCAAD